MQRIAIGAAALLLTLVFMYLRFPYERLAERIEAEVGQRTSWDLRLIDLGPHPTLFGPGVAAGPVTLDTPQRSQEFEQVVIRPAWSPSWLALAPALHLSVEGTGIQLEGTLTLGSPPHFEGELIDSEPRALLGEDSALELSGRLDADCSLSLGPPAPGGPCVLSLQDGVVGHPLIPIQIPYDRFDAELEADARGTLTILSAELQSPMLSAQASGTLGMLPGGSLDVNLDLEPNDDLRALLRAQGMRAGRDGRISLHLGGTTSKPTLR
jgi:type II secretion system protein N